MEQKKALWISLSAGIFLLTVFGVALFISSQNAKNNVNAISLKGTDSFWISPPPAKKSQSYPTINVTDNTTDKQPELSVSQNSNPVSGTYMPNQSESKQEKEPLVPLAQPTEGQAASPALSISNTSAAEAVSTTAVTAQNATAEKAMEEAKATTAKATSNTAQKPAPKKTETTKKTEATSAPKAATTTSKTPAAKTAATTQYWVQVSSYSAKKNADEARSILDSSNLQCEVFTYTKDGTMYYRVRVGPYSSKAEADKAKTKVDGISQFKNAGSYVVTVKKEN